MTKMTKNASALAVLGIAAGIATATIVQSAGEARGEDAAIASYDAAPAPAVAPDAALAVEPPAGSTLPPLPPIDDDGAGFLLSSYRWLTSGSGWLALVPILIAVSWLLLHPRMFLLKNWKAYQRWISGRRGKVAVVVLAATAGMFAHALAATGGLPDPDVIARLVPQVLSAMGGYEGLRILVFG